jgi:predicted kinase
MGYLTRRRSHGSGVRRAGADVEWRGGLAAGEASRRGADRDTLNRMATLHFVAGKAGAGKTTLAREIARTAPALLICEDEWMSKLAGKIENLSQYLEAAERIRSVIAPLAIDVLSLGTSVVFDFAGNTAGDRRWVRSIFMSAAADHLLHYLSVDDETCKERVRQRNAAQPAGVFFGVVSEDQVDEVNKYFAPPCEDEGLEMVVYNISR